LYRERPISSLIAFWKTQFTFSPFYMARKNGLSPFRVASIDSLS